MQSDPGPNLCYSAPPDTKAHYWKVIMKRFLHIRTMILNPKQEFSQPEENIFRDSESVSFLNVQVLMDESYFLIQLAINFMVLLQKSSET